ncbi:hypothetical protein [Nitrosomonas oligotropha]|uniref:hypothetical protein n=1 Tax=Nitrosomonas oligotropha TaxID=42354 RepID=UPI000B7D49AC|nr:hypothetical protein [Nitrosomonas oligotropha]
MNLYKIDLLDIRFLSTQVAHILPYAATGWNGNRVFKVFLESSMKGKMHSITKVAELSGYAADITPGTGCATFNFLSSVMAFSF